MYSIASILIFLFGIVAFGALIFTFADGIWYTIKYFFIKTTEPVDYFRSQIIPSNYQVVLANQFTYYKNLSVSERIRFTGRVKRFAEKKEFIGRNNLTVTEEMKVLISASAIQLTFGLDEYMLGYFEKIFIYPDVYYSKLTGKYHMGDVNIGGAIAISWKSFKEGYSSPSDNYNVGLHEMAHALRFSHFRGDDFDHFFVKYFDKWTGVSMEEFTRIKHGEHSMIREYAGTNLNEFFAVCAEYFFESPFEFKQKLPEIFTHMCILLNQNPLENFSAGLSVRKKWFDSLSEISLMNLQIRSGINILPIVLYALFAGFILFPVILSGGFYDMSIKQITFLSAFLIIVYVLVARQVNRFSIYQNGIEVSFPFLGNRHRFLFDHIVSMTFFRASTEAIDPDRQNLVKLIVSSSIEIVYAASDEVSSKTFSIRLEDDTVKKIISSVRKEKFLVKVYGDKWEEKAPALQN